MTAWREMNGNIGRHGGGGMTVASVSSWRRREGGGNGGPSSVELGQHMIRRLTAITPLSLSMSYLNHCVACA